MDSKKKYLAGFISNNIGSQKQNNIDQKQQFTKSIQESQQRSLSESAGLGITPKF